MADTPRTPTVGAITILNVNGPRVANPIVTVPANNAITVSGALSLAKSLARASLTGSVRAGQAGDGYMQSVADIGTAEEILDVGDMGQIGWCAFKNRDATNFVQLGKSPGVYTLKLGPGEFHGPMVWNGPLIYAKADTATCKIDYLVIER
jgi:hypothetical protein